MEGCEYITRSSLVNTGKTFLVGALCAYGMFEAYYPEAHSTLPKHVFVEQAMDAILYSKRYEAYLFDPYSGKLVAALIMWPGKDLHRGLVAEAAVCYVVPELRSNRCVVKWLASTQKHAAQALDCGGYVRVKHLSDNTRLITFKEV